jgi:hypothetical protein
MERSFQISFRRTCPPNLPFPLSPEESPAFSTGIYALNDIARCQRFTRIGSGPPTPLREGWWAFLSPGRDQPWGTGRGAFPRCISRLHQNGSTDKPVEDGCLVGAGGTRGGPNPSRRLRGLLHRGCWRYPSQEMSPEPGLVAGEELCEEAILSRRSRERPHTGAVRFRDRSRNSYSTCSSSPLVSG